MSTVYFVRRQAIKSSNGIDTNVSLFDVARVESFLALVNVLTTASTVRLKAGWTRVTNRTGVGNALIATQRVNAILTSRAFIKIGGTLVKVNAGILRIVVKEPGTAYRVAIEASRCIDAFFGTFQTSG